MAVQVHAASLFCFLLLLIVQTLAIRYRAISTHRILGRFSNIVIPTALIFSVAILWKKYHKHLTDGATVATARNAEFLSAAQLLLFVALYAVSIAAMGRRDVATHMRCMICIALVLLPTGMARVLGYLIHVRQAPSPLLSLPANRPKLPHGVLSISSLLSGAPRSVNPCFSNSALRASAFAGSASRARGAQSISIKPAGL